MAESPGFVTDDMFEGDSDLTYPGNHMMNATSVVTGEDYINHGENGIDCRDLIEDMPYLLSMYTFSRLIICVGSNENDLITNPWRTVYNHLIYDFMAGYAAKLKIIFDQVPNTIRKTLLFTQPRAADISAYIKYRTNREYHAKLGRATELDFCVRENIRYVDFYSEVIQKTATDYRVDIMSFYYSENVGDSDWGIPCQELIGTYIPVAVVPTRTRYTGKTNVWGGNGDGWDTGSLTGDAEIIGDAAWGSLSLLSIGDTFRNYVHAHGPLPTSALRYTVAVQGDPSKVDVYMRVSSKNLVRDYEYADAPWIKTTTLDVVGCPFCQFKLVSTAINAVITSVTLTYEVLS